LELYQAIDSSPAAEERWMESSEGLGTSGEPSGCSTERERRRGRDREVRRRAWP